MNVPNVLYFGSARRHDQLSGRVFLTPYKGIASLFCLDVDVLAPYIEGYLCNLDYPAWYWPNEKLQNPLPHVQIVHNIAENAGMRGTGTAKGYIHAVNVRPVKHLLTLFATNDPDREVIYEGAEPLDILSAPPHEFTWEISFDPAALERHGPAVKAP